MRHLHTRRTIIQTSMLLASGVARAENIVSIRPDEIILPDATDDKIKTFNNPQAVYAPKGEARNQLFMFLTGTHGDKPFGYRLSTNAALLGYHVIQPMYNDDVPASVCSNDENADAFAKFRWAIIEGGTSPYLKDEIPRTESIENRAVKLLQYLDRSYPLQGWGQFFKGNQIVWAKVAIGGMSQGGGHAALIATKYLVPRVLCFGAPKDYSARLNAPAKWYDESVTPASRYFAFNNTHDRQGCDYREEVEILDRLGLTKIAGGVNVDTSEPPYNHSRVLFTDWPGPGATVESIRAHVSVINDHLLVNRVPIFRPVWQYMLTESTD